MTFTCHVFPLVCSSFSLFLKTWVVLEFPGGPVVSTWCYHCWGSGFSSWPGTKIPQSHGMAKKRTWTVLRRNGRSPVECPPICVVFLPIRPGLYSFNVWVISGDVMDREAWRAAVHGVTKSRTNWATELNWTDTFLKRTPQRWGALLIPSYQGSAAPTQHHWWDSPWAYV